MVCAPIRYVNASMNVGPPPERARSSASAVTAYVARTSAASMFEHVYATPNSVVEAERQWFESYEASFLEGEGSHR